MTTDDLSNRIEAALMRHSTAIQTQIAANHAEVKGWIFGGPDGPGLAGRIQPLERDMATAKRAIAIGGAGFVAMLWDAIKKKFSIG